VSTLSETTPASRVIDDIHELNQTLDASSQASTDDQATDHVAGLSAKASEKAAGGEDSPVPIVPDFGMAREHLTLLDPNSNAKFTFQVFDDKQGLKRKQQRALKLELAQEMGLEPKQKRTPEQKLELESRLKQKLELRPELKVLPADIIHGSFDSVKDRLAAYNKRGYGVFVTVNETDGRGRSTENITRVRAVFQEKDGDGTIEEDQVDLANCILGPSISVQSSLPSKIHDWFLCDPSDPLSVDDYEGIQRRMIKSHGSCEDAKDLARVLRVAGFFHCKYAPIMSRLISGDGERYSSGMLKLAFPPIPVPKALHRPSRAICCTASQLKR
jgi:hypothetical protein